MASKKTLENVVGAVGGLLAGLLFTAILFLTILRIFG